MSRDASDLPVAGALPDVLAALDEGRRLVLEAPPGAGKTTLVPLALAEASWSRSDRVVVLEPRRVVARAAARRMADLVGDHLGGHVGVTTRDDRRTSSATRVEVVTEGVLVRRLQRDPALDGVAAVVLDEFHERSLEADLALAFSLDVAGALREDLRVVVMSATLDGARVARLVDGAVVRSRGRLHPVEVEYRDRPLSAPLEPAVAEAVLHALAGAGGGVLAFLPGVGEIRRTASELAGRLPDDVEVLPLHGGLGPDEQDRAVTAAPAGTRRVVLATDLAESSLTIPGVEVVVDSGLAREPRFDVRTGATALRTVRISRDRADQRAGRAGRTGPGRCIRLWARRLHHGLPATRTPALAQQDLAGFALEVAAWGATPDELRLLDPPPQAAWGAAVDLLRSLDAVDGAGRITPHGRDLVALPLPPRLAHLIASARPGESALAVDVAAVLADRDLVRDRAHSDLATRVRALRGQAVPAGVEVRERAVPRARREAARLGRVVGTERGRGAVLDAEVARLAARAFPDRVAVARGTRGALTMARGRGARLDPADPLAGEDLVVVADLDAAGEDARVFVAAALARDDLDAELGHLVEEVAHVGYDPGAGDVVAERRRVLGALVLDAGPLEDPPDAATTTALLTAVSDQGLRLLPWDRESEGVRTRAQFLHDTLGAPWPPLDDAALLDDLERWLGPYLAGLHRVAHLRRAPLADALRGRIGFDLARRLDQLAPTHLTIPTGRRVRLRYDRDEGVVLAAKLQELFGWRATPRIAGGAAAVTVHLLSPAGRPVQVTTDLAGFWEGGYAQVRAELRGRYPKHPWPADPTTATPTARTTRALRRGG